MDFSNATKWIWSGNDKINEWNMFRKKLTIPHNITGARLLVTAGCYHETYINGRLVTRGPGLSYDFAKYYDDIDVTSYLTAKKENILAILSAGFKSKGVLAQLILSTEKNENTIVSTDATWLIHRHDSFKTDMPFTITDGRCEEYFDDRLELKNWNLLEFDDSNWENSKELGPVGTPPWTRMERSAIGLLTSEPVFPK